MVSGMMNKAKVFKDNEKKIMSLIHKYKHIIHDYEVEDLHQEVLTHLDVKLNDYDKDKASVDTFVYMVTKNKLYNMANNKHNRKDVLVSERKLEDIMEDNRKDFTFADKIALEVAFDVMYKHKHSDLLYELFKGAKQHYVAEKHGVSQQYVSKLWNEFVDTVKNELWRFIRKEKSVWRGTLE